jgi:hypothetical protein
LLAIPHRRRRHPTQHAPARAWRAARPAPSRPPREATAVILESDGEAARAVERLREMLAAHYSDERGVVLDSRSWLITARRRR